jgi:hypothetical protein
MPVEEEDVRQAACKRSDKLKPCFAEQKERCRQTSARCQFSHDPTVLKNALEPPELGQRSSGRGSRGDRDGVYAGCQKPGHGVQNCPMPRSRRPLLALRLLRPPSRWALTTTWSIRHPKLGHILAFC